MPITKAFDPFAASSEVEFPAAFRVFQDSLNRLFEPSTARPWAPAVDILETENELVVKADLPDVSLKEINIELEQGTLTIKGERKFERVEGKGTGYHRLERSYGQFMRCFSVPESVDSEKVRADYKAGVLTVVLPKKEAAKPRSIKVDVTGE